MRRGRLGLGGGLRGGGLRAVHQRRGGLLSAAPEPRGVPSARLRETGRDAGASGQTRDRRAANKTVRSFAREEGFDAITARGRGRTSAAAARQQRASCLEIISNGVAALRAGRPRRRARCFGPGTPRRSRPQISRPMGDVRARALIRVRWYRSKNCFDTSNTSATSRVGRPFGFPTHIATSRGDGATFSESPTRSSTRFAIVSTRRDAHAPRAVSPRRSGARARASRRFGFSDVLRACRCLGKTLAASRSVRADARAHPSPLGHPSRAGASSTFASRHR